MVSKKEFDKLTEALNSFDLSLNLEEFEDRMKIQKIAYILKALGYPLTYKFSFYVRGPYSKKLADDYYNLRNREKLNKFGIAQNLEANELNIINNIKEVISKDISTRILEGISTILYFHKEKGLDFEDSFKRTEEIKDSLSKEELLISLNRVKELLIKKEDYDRIKEELEEIQAYQEF